MIGTPMVEARNLTCKYPKSERNVLEDLTFKINTGEMVLVMGPTGCGKTTLCLCLNGMIPESMSAEVHGQVLIDGRPISGMSVAELAKKTAIVFQNPDEQISSLFVEEEVAFGPENLLVSGGDLTGRIREAIEFSGLTGLEDRIVYNLSGGQKQRVAIAAVLAMRPAVLILDSPLSNLDPLGVSEILQVIRRLGSEHKLTTIIAEHRVDDLIDVVDKILVLNKKGQLHSFGTPTEVLAEARVLRDELGLYIPEITDTALALEGKCSFEKLPLSISDFPELDFGNQEGKVGAPTLPAEPNPIISVRNLSFSYPDGTTALKNINLDMEGGDFVALVGQNGSGKTTLAYILMGLMKATKGSVTVDGLDLSKTKMTQLAKSITYVFQFPEHQFIENTVQKEMAFEIRKDKALSETEVLRRAAEEIEKIGLRGFETRHPYDLSLGEKRVLSVAIMTIHNPKAIILDEPTYGQDWSSTATLMGYMVKLNKEGRTIIMITHDMRLVADYSRSVFALSEGQLAFGGRPLDFFTNEDLLRKLHLSAPAIVHLSQKLLGRACLTTEEFASQVIGRRLISSGVG